MSNLALLVDCLKIITWLEDRKKLRKDWYNYLKAAEEKLKLLLKDREWAINYPHIHDFLAQNQHTFNSIDVARTVELLLLTDIGQQKSLIFGFSDQRVKEWTTLKKYLEGNCLGLLNLAKFIEQSLRFDLPGLNKTIEGYDSQLSTLKRKIDFNNNTIYQETKGLQRERALLGLDSVSQSPIEELIQLVVARAPEKIGKLEQMMQTDEVKRYLRYYKESNEQSENELRVLEYFIENGDQFELVFESEENRDKFASTKKYGEFERWKGTNEWEIEIQGQSQKKEQVVDNSTVIEKREFRQRLLYDLSQLTFFFKGTKHELSTAEKGLGFESEQTKQTNMVEGQIDGAISCLQNIISYLTSKQLTAPLELKNSKKAYQVLVRQFMGFEANIGAMQSQIKSYKEQIIDLQKKREKQVQKLTFLRKKVAACRPVCESLLSEIVKREVKVTGEINKLD